MCKLCALHNTSAKAAVDSVRLVFTFRCESEAICSDDFHEHIVDQMSFDHDDGNFELIIDKYSAERKRFDAFMSDAQLLESRLKEGETKARKIAQEVLGRVRSKLGVA